MPAKKATKKSTRSKRTAPAKKKASPKGRSSSTKAKSSKAGKKEVTIDRRRSDDRRDEENMEAVSPVLERREKVQRRRQIDPTTCERDYTDDEVVFMNAMDEYKRQSGRMFPTCSEVLEVIRGLGYAKLSPSELALRSANDSEGNEIADTEDSSDKEALESNQEALETSQEAEELATNGWTV